MPALSLGPTVFTPKLSAWAESEIMDLIVEKQDGARVGPRGGRGGEGGGLSAAVPFRKLFTDEILEPRYKVSKSPYGP